MVFTKTSQNCVNPKLVFTMNENINHIVLAVWILSILLQKNAEIFYNDDCRNKCQELTIWIKS